MAIELEVVQDHPELLIPDRLKELVSNPESIVAIPRTIWMGRLNDDYRPPIALLLAERGGLPHPTDMQETDGTKWAEVLNFQRIKAIQEGLLGEGDRALIWTIARLWYPSGVYFETYVDAESLRGQYLGTGFFSNAEAVFQSLGYKYWGGEANKDNLPFYRKLGVTTTDQVLANVLPVHPRTNLHTIKFMDAALEAAALSSREMVAV
jgi:hypothetical protein